MAATGRLLRTSRPCVGIGNSQSCYSFSGSKGSSARFVSKGGFGGEKGIGDGEKQTKSATKVVAAAATSARCLVTPEPKTEKGLLDLGLLLGKISTLMFQRLRIITIRLPQKLHAQILMEKAIVDCRFFTWFAVAGSLLGSVLCFIKTDHSGTDDLAEATRLAKINEIYFNKLHAKREAEMQGKERRKAADHRSALGGMRLECCQEHTSHKPTTTTGWTT